MGENNDVVRHREFDRYREAVDRRLADLERDVDALESEHDTDMDQLATQRTTDLQKANERRQQHREWTWGQVIGTIAAAAALGAFALQARGH